MKNTTTEQFQFVRYLILLMVLAGGLVSMPASAQTEVNEIQKMINDVPANTTKVIDLKGTSYVLTSSVNISGGRRITLKNGTLERSKYYSGTFVSVSNSSLTLESIVIDGNKDKRSTTGPLVYLNSSELFVKTGTVIKNNDIVSSVTAGGIIVDSNSSLTMTGGEVYGCYDYDMGQVYVAPGGEFNMTGGEIWSVCASSENTPADVVIGGAAKITMFFRLYAGSYLKLSSALQNKMPVRNTSSLVTTGTIAATGTGGYSPTMSDVGKFVDYGNRWLFDLKDGNIIFTSKSSVANSEDDLQKKIDASPVGSQDSPTSITVGNVELKKGVTIDGKYITLTGGTILGNSNNAWISLKGGGLNLNQINITNKGLMRKSPWMKISDLST